ncbi:MAG: cache domain-containing protein, partial [Candidatus Krumholzibacteriia bacterium]
LEFIASWAESRRQDIVLWSGQYSIAQAISSTREDDDGQSGSFLFVREANEDLRRYSRAYPDYAEIGISAANGNVLTNSLVDLTKEKERRLDSGVHVRDMDYFQQAMQGRVAVTGVRRNQDTGSPVFVIASPVRQIRDGMASEVAGILYGVVDWLFFTRQFVEPVKIGTHGYVYIVDPEGTVIAHPDKRRPGSPPPPRRCS